ncbi:MAG: SulP family sulfate permease [Maribacter sp.]|jgi:SulP family sulfate permease
MKYIFNKYIVPVWWRGYRREFIKGDISAGFTIGVMLIPQGMAYAMLAGMPPIYGLYAAVFPPIVYAWLGSSRRLAVGPAAITCILVTSAIAPLAAIESPEYVAYAALLSVLTGLVYIIFLLLRLSKFANLLTAPINKGFAAAGGIIIFVNQLKYLFDVDINRGQNVAVLLKELLSKNEDINWVTFAIGMIGIAFLYFVPKWKKTFPIALIVIMFSILAVWGMRLDLQEVSIMGAVPEGLPELVDIPEEWDLEFLWNAILLLLPKAVIIFLVGFATSISVAKIVAERNGLNDVRPRRDLFAIGLANIVSGMFGSVVVNGSLSRTMVNDQAGARSGLSLVLSAILVLLTLLFLTPLFFYLPKAILASVIMVAISKLINPMDAIGFYKSSIKEFLTYLVTFLGVLLISIEWGIVLGLVFSLVLKLFKDKSDDKVKSA